MRKIWILIICLVIIPLVVLLVLHKGKPNRQINLTQEQKEILEVAHKKARELGYEPDKVNFFYDVNNKAWNDTYGLAINNKEISLQNDEYKKLVGRNFQAVHYSSSKKYSLGGDIFVLIDKKTKEVIIVQRGK